MDYLELNIHQQILFDLAAQAGEDEHELLTTTDFIRSKAQDIPHSEEPNGDITDSDGLGSRTFMSEARAHCNIAFGELVVNFPDAHVDTQKDTLINILTDLLRDITRTDFDECLSWDEWALPDQLVYSTVSALLHISSRHEDYNTSVVDSITMFISDTVGQLKQATSVGVLTQLTPAIHGLYRAITSTSYPWSAHQWCKLSNALRLLVAPEVLERINRLLLDIHQELEADADAFTFCHTFIARYINQERPLSGYFIVCCVMEMQWTILAQVLAPPEKAKYGPGSEAAAANRALLALIRHPALGLDITDAATRSSLKETIQYAGQCFSDLLLQIENMDTDPPIDTYAWETMSESLKLASICAVALRELDSDIYEKLRLLLSEESPLSDSLVQEAALKAMTVLVQSFPEIAPDMVNHLRRFVTAPLPIFEFEFGPERRTPPALVAAAKCLALCIQLTPEDDTIMSNMYSLLNYIAAASKEITEGAQVFNNPFHKPPPSERMTLQSEDTGLRGMSEEEKRLVGKTTISVVSRLALVFDVEEVTRLTVSMLLQRLRTAEPSIEATIAYNLVDLALTAPESSFIDIIRAFSNINRAANSDDPRYSNNMVLASQTRLAKEIDRRADLYELYLVELLTLFSDKGVSIQNVAISDHHAKTEEMTAQLASLLLPIEALLTHADFNPQTNASEELVSLFRNMWFLCVLFHFTSSESEAREKNAMDWVHPALARIASKTPSIVLEGARNAASEVEYSTVIRHEYAHSNVTKHRTLVNRHISIRSAEIRSLSTGQIIFLLTMHDMESMRSAAGLPSSLATYFANGSLNNHPGMSACMDSIADKVMRGSIADLNAQAMQQALPSQLSNELRTLLVYSTHRVTRVREAAFKYLSRLITSFPSLMCDAPLVYAILEVLTLLRRACENEFMDEYNPVYEYHSERADVSLHLTDDYKCRNEILAQLNQSANQWFELALNRAPYELHSTLQKYLAATQSLSGPATSELGASIAEQFGKSFGRVQRHLSSLGTLSHLKSDRARVMASQLASKGYYAGEAAGIRLANRKDEDDLDKLPPQSAPAFEIEGLKRKMEETLEDIRGKQSALTVQDLKRLLFRCAALLISLEKCDYALLRYLVILPCEVFTPAAISAGVEVWTWVIAEKQEIEVALMTEIVTVWFRIVKDRKGVFSTSSNYDDPFYHPIDYAPTDREEIDRNTSHARRLLMPHTLLIQMLFSKLQSARYCKPTVMFLIQRLVLQSARAYRSFSTHPLSRELRFSFLLFGFEALKSSSLDSCCEYMIRESLYRTAYAWFAVRPQWSYGANRVQIQADIQSLSDFLSYLQSDSVVGLTSLSSLSPVQLASRASWHISRLKSINQPLRLLVENEIYRLVVWGNPSNDPKRNSMDQVGTTERTMLESTWPGLIRTLWEIDPAIAIQATERFKSNAAHSEASLLVRTKPADVLHTPEALQLLIGETSDGKFRRELKHILLWAPVPPVLAITFFERRYNNDPLLLQYAHRVLQEHPVDLTFFFVPQIVQALRFDDLGYVAEFIFETAKISQLFCHQIIWNMKANCYKDDAAEIEDPMKPALDKMTDMVVRSLSGEAKSFYDREFSFFHEVTSISGKLKPFIKKSKQEKKAKIDEEMAKIIVDVGVYLPSNPDGEVIDIDKKSGRPLQSHAKAPFMASFKVRKEKTVINDDAELLLDGSGIEKQEEYTVWQQAIFKVGDDCRQDVLALQVIAMFKNIYTSVGLTLYLYPYRVTATAPGCGVIDVVPNATSRDEMGRAKVNDLLDFFVSKYGSQETVAFQRARHNFIQSMAAYSVACYILQIKDRHNGNIMIDGEGHIVHIDFGFLFDIGPGGVKFEPNSFKLNHEMVVLMGGRYSQGYELFQHLTIKAFLAIRPYADQIVSTVQLMLGTGLPSFKGEPTIKRLRDRFALGLNERQAAEWMMGVIRNAHENVRSVAYDEFQRIQNGIPYK